MTLNTKELGERFSFIKQDDLEGGSIRWMFATNIHHLIKTQFIPPFQSIIYQMAQQTLSEMIGDPTFLFYIMTESVHTYLYQRVFWYNKQYTMIESSLTPEQFVVKMYLHACQLAHLPSYSPDDHEQLIKEALRTHKIHFKDIRKIVQYSKQDWVQDLLEVTQDLRTVLSNSPKNFVRFLNRSRMHFGGAHLAHLSQREQKKPARRVMEMYREGKFEWNENTEDFFISSVFPNCVYVMGLTKGNAVIINSNTLLSCAHVFIDQDTENPFQIRCFANGHGDYGIVRVGKNDLFENEDVGFGEILYFSGENIRQVSLGTPRDLKFKDFIPIKCVQLGLLFDPDNFVETFYTTQGFIERNLYADENDTKLVEEMGLLVHDCYGLHGTSGSPLWSENGQLVGIHNAWNSEGYNVSMIVHDDEDDEDGAFEEVDECRVTKQYERRAVSVHVLRILQDKWMNRKGKAFKKTEKQRSKESLFECL